jgi:hypothetical protein
LAMMNTRLSANAADAANRDAQAKSAGRDRMLHRSMRGPLWSDKPKTLRMINQDGWGRLLPQAGFSEALDAGPKAGP